MTSGDDSDPRGDRDRPSLKISHFRGVNGEIPILDLDGVTMDPPLPGKVVMVWISVADCAMQTEAPRGCSMPIARYCWSPPSNSALTSRPLMRSDLNTQRLMVDALGHHVSMALPLPSSAVNGAKPCKTWIGETFRRDWIRHNSWKRHKKQYDKHNKDKNATKREREK